ncbi:hypothetical protein K435DRAFT_862991 [Dendrothele bispora CBS 962.96]|uniref:Uncharacterized protein n=1 Tax=Dendrothele bispora (strain CBS 962.96) TaxID=1314807 RepID=A0A4S8LR88_DENBC|nr:hypothetical protein K435DRAFT_862991 [Dendrothele bispora CBS 962.96]
MSTTSSAEAPGENNDSVQLNNVPSNSGPSSEEQAPYSIQVDAQLYPWMYMTSTLEACFKNDEETTHEESDSHSKAVNVEEAAVSDPHVQAEAEQPIKFYDELSSDKLAKEAPKVMHSFQTHGDACAQVESEALQIASKDMSDVDLDDYENNPMKPYDDMLEKLEALQIQASELEIAILRLTEPMSAPTLPGLSSGISRSDADNSNSIPEQIELEETKSTPESNSDPSSAPESSLELPPPSNGISIRTEPKEPSAETREKEAEAAVARSQIAPIFDACLPILRARKANIEMAQQLVEGAKEMLAMTLHLESLGSENGDGDDYNDVENDDDEDSDTRDSRRDTRLAPGGNSSDDE